MTFVYGRYLALPGAVTMGTARDCTPKLIATSSNDGSSSSSSSTSAPFLAVPLVLRASVDTDAPTPQSFVPNMFVTYDRGQSLRLMRELIAKQHQQHGGGGAIP